MLANDTFAGPALMLGRIVSNVLAHGAEDAARTALTNCVKFTFSRLRRMTSNVAPVVFMFLVS